MFELEAKVPITAKVYSALQKKLKQEAKHLGTRINEDSYYEDPKKAFIRIRRRGESTTFDLKLRQVVDGIESNIEMEWGIKDLGKWKGLLKKLQIRPSMRKTKKSEVYEMDGFTIELNKINKLGYFLEIERMVQKESDLDSEKKSLLKLFKSLGYSQNDFEERPYLELLKNV